MMRKKFLVRIVAAFLGVGFLPLVPATWASALAAALAWYLPGNLLGWILGLTAAGLWACRPSQSIFNSKDPKPFVMDEVCGMMLSVLWLPKNGLLFLAAFVLFRILDVWKPWPISRIQDSRHPWSIMGDDLLAGLFANLILRLAIKTIC